jgi:hypothetical protein
MESGVFSADVASVGIFANMDGSAHVCDRLWNFPFSFVYMYGVCELNISCASKLEIVSFYTNYSKIRRLSEDRNSLLLRVFGCFRPRPGLHSLRLIITFRCSSTHCRKISSSSFRSRYDRGVAHPVCSPLSVGEYLCWRVCDCGGGD